MAGSKERFRVLRGINYVPDGKRNERRAEVGDIVSDLPKAAKVDRLIRSGVLERVVDEGKGAADGAV